MEDERRRWGETASSVLGAAWRFLTRGGAVLGVVLGIIANVVTAFAPLPVLSHLPFLGSIGSFLAAHLELWSALLAGLVVALVLYTGWLSSRVRHRLLVLSQRRRPPAGVLLLVGLPALVFLALALGVFPLVLGALAHSSSSPDAEAVRWVVVVGTAVITGSVTLWLVVSNWRMRISANQCRSLVQTVDDQRPSTRYEFDTAAPSSLVRRQARLLDYLAGKRLAGVRRTRLGWSYSIAAPLDEHSLRLDDTSTSAERDLELTHLANRIWTEATTTGTCWPIGGLAPTIQHEKIFGNPLDSLFNSGAGFRVYDAGGPRFVVVVLKGQPGAGKSTLALQMCVTMARQGHLCIYYSLEEERAGLLQSAKNFGWDRPDRNAHYAGVHSYTINKSLAQVHVRQRLLKRRDRQQRAGQGLFARWRRPPVPPAQPDGMVLVSSLGDRAMRLSQRRAKLQREWGHSLKTVASLPEAVRCVVIDSLEGFANVGVENVERAGLPRDQLLGLKAFFQDRCEMLVLLLEDDGSGTSGYAEFVADVVIQLGRRSDDNYLFLFAEILKARNQTHALGQSQIKIRAQEDLVHAREAVAEAVFELQPGIQVFPSLHYRLFQSKQESTFDEYTMSTGLTGLDEMYSEGVNAQGVRRKTATALIGPRDSGKSLIGMNFLIEGVRENTRTLLLSLRDDAGTVMKRPIPQEPGQMRFSWRDMPPALDAPASAADQKKDAYHQLDWELDGILKWAEDRRPHRPQTLQMPWRLPYLFVRPPVTYSQLVRSPILLAEAQATTRYLERLVGELRSIRRDFPFRDSEGCLVAGDYWRIEWTAAARERARSACQRAWAAFERDLALSIRTAQALVELALRSAAPAPSSDAAGEQDRRRAEAEALVAGRFYSTPTGTVPSLSPEDERLLAAAAEEVRRQLLSDVDQQPQALAQDTAIPLEDLVLTPTMAEVLRQHLQSVRDRDTTTWKRLEWAPTLTAAIADGFLPDASAPPPCLRWDSRYWDEKKGRMVPGADLLVLKPWRPGNITPDDFVDQVLRVIGEPPLRAGRLAGQDDMDPESVFERVVFDDVAQLPQRYPILDKTRLFLPTLIDTFKARGITSLFLADTVRAPAGSAQVSGSGAQPAGDPYGLEVLADHIIRTGITPAEQERGPRLVVEVRGVPAVPHQEPHWVQFDTSQPDRPVTVELVRLASLAPDAPKQPTSSTGAANPTPSDPAPGHPAH